MRYFITKKNYKQEISSSLDGWGDYMVAKKKGSRDFIFNLDNLEKDHISNVKPFETTADSIKFKFESKDGRKLKLPFVLYNGIDYTVDNNNKTLKHFNDKQILSVVPKVGKNTLTVSAKAPRYSYMTFGISIFMILGGISTYIMLSTKRKSHM